MSIINSALLFLLVFCVFVFFMIRRMNSKNIANPQKLQVKKSHGLLDIHYRCKAKIINTLIESNNEILYEIQRVLSLTDQTNLVLMYRRLIHEISLEIYGFNLYNTRMPPFGTEFIEADYSEITVERRNKIRLLVEKYPHYVFSLTVGLVLNDENLAWSLCEDI